MSKVKRFAVLLLLAVFFASFYYNFVYTDFKKYKKNLIEQNIFAENNTLSFKIPASELQGIGIPIVEVKLQNPRSRNTRLKFLFNSIELSDVILPAEGTKKYAIDIDEKIRDKNTLELKGDESGWMLEYLEIKNFYGYSKGFITFVTINKSVSYYNAIPFFSSFGLFLILFLLGFFFAEEKRIARHKFVRLIQLFILVLFVPVFLIPLFSKYKLLLHSKPFFLLLVLFYIPLLISFFREACRFFRSLSPERKSLISSAIIVLAIFLFFFSSMQYSLHNYGDNYSGFIKLGEKFFKYNPIMDEHRGIKEGLLIHRDGYDGQFFYYMTFDPFVNRFKSDPKKYRLFIDTPPYRYGRIGFSALIKLFSINRPEYYPKTMIFLILISHIVGAFFLSRIIIFYKKSILWTFLYLLIPGFHISLDYALPESIAAAFLLGGFYCYLKEKIPASLVFFTASIFVRETGILLVFVIAAYEFIKNKNLKRSFVIILPVIPYFLWRIFLTWRLFDYWGWETLFFNPGTVTIPLAGFVDLFSAIRNGNYISQFVTAGILFPILLILLFLLASFFLWKRKDFLSLAFFILCLLSISQDFLHVWRHVGNGERTTYEVFLFLILIFASSKKGMTIYLKLAFVIIFIFVFLYEFHFLTLSNHFRAGFNIFGRGLQSLLEIRHLF